MRIEWSQNCALQHDGWQVMFWDMPAVLRLLQEEYPWFLSTFESYKRRVQQGPARHHALVVVNVQHDRPEFAVQA